MFFLTPKYIKHGQIYIKEARKRLNYNRDKWSADSIEEFESAIKELQKAVKARDKAAVEAGQARLNSLAERLCPLPKDAWISENVEVFLVAFIVALGIRTYILQPFTIPTSSMYPTLCGVIGTATKEEPPNALAQVWQFAAYGRSWHNVIAQADETITSVKEGPGEGIWRFLTYTRIDTSAGNTYWINQLSAPIEQAWGQGAGKRSLLGMHFKKDEPIIRGYTTTGDHVFVDKVSYHFRSPKRGEVFVFTTADIPKQSTARGLRGAPPRDPSQFYIKRLAGVPGDTLRISQPHLFVNDKAAEEWPFQRVGAMQNGYRGYTNMFGWDHLAQPGEPYAVSEKGYFALGDNSPDSLDSRAWGEVPEQNLVGPGFMVYWPFLREPENHFGLIR